MQAPWFPSPYDTTTQLYVYVFLLLSITRVLLTVQLVLVMNIVIRSVYRSTAAYSDS